jgi:hypothetical protein
MICWPERAKAEALAYLDATAQIRQTEVGIRLKLWRTYANAKSINSSDRSRLTAEALPYLDARAQIL